MISFEINWFKFTKMLQMEQSESVILNLVFIRREWAIIAVMVLISEIHFNPSVSLRKHPFLLALRRWGRFAQNVLSDEERGETDVFAGYPSVSFRFLFSLIYYYTLWDSYHEFFPERLTFQTKVVLVWDQASRERSERSEPREGKSIARLALACSRLRDSGEK